MAMHVQNKKYKFYRTYIIIDIDCSTTNVHTAAELNRHSHSISRVCSLQLILKAVIPCRWNVKDNVHFYEYIMFCQLKV